MKNFYLRIFFTLSLILAGFAAIAQPTFEINNIKDPCDGLANGSFEVLVTSATGGVTLDVYGERDGDPIVREDIPANVPFLVDKMMHGNIVVVVSYNGRNAATDIFSLVARSAPIIDQIILEKNSCTGSADGSADLIVSGGTGNYLLSLDGGQSFVANPINGLAGGTYTVTVYDEGTNCSEEVEITIEDELSLTVEAPAAFCGDAEPVNLEDYITPSVAGGAYTFNGEGVTGSSFDPAKVTLSGSSKTLVIEVTYEVNECIVADELSVEVNKVPQAPSVENPIEPVCQNEDAPVVSFKGEEGANIRIYADAELNQELAAGTSFDPDSDPAFSSATANIFTYYVIQELNGCRSDIFDFSIEVLAKPEADFASNSIEICEGESAEFRVNFTGQPDFTLLYAVNGEEKTASVNAQHYTIELGKPEKDVTVELISLIDATNCAVAALEKTAVVTVNARPVAEINSFDPVCVEDPAFELTKASPAGGVYDGPGVSLREGVYFFSPADAGVDTHTITYTITNATTGCDSTAEASIVVNALPDVSFAAFTEAVCVNAEEPVILTGGSPAGGIYSGTAVSVEDGVYKFDPATAGVGTYTITYTYADGNGCEASATQDITVGHAVAPENLRIAASNEGEDLCADDQVTLTASADFAGEGAVYRWFKNEETTPIQEGEGNTFTFTPANGDVIRLTLSQGTFACGTGEIISKQTAAFTVNERPDIVSLPEDVTICQGGDAILDFEFSGLAPFTLTYSASTAEGQTSIEVNKNTLQLGTSPDKTTTYTLVSIEDANCSRILEEQSVTVTVNQQPVPAVKLAASATEICAGAEVLFSATPENEGEGAVYEWYVNGELVPDHNETTYSFTPAHEDQVYVKLIQGTVLCGSGTTAKSNVVTIDAEQKPSASFSGPATFCLGDKSVQYEAVTAGGTFTATFEGKEVAVITVDGTFAPKSAGVYTIIYSVASERGCENESEPFTVTVNDIEELAITLEREQTSDAVCAGENAFTYTVNITNGGQDPQIQWFINDEPQVGETGTEFTISNLAAGIYAVSVTVQQGTANEELVCGNNSTLSESDEIAVHEKATAKLADASESICKGDEIALRFTLTGTAPFSFSYSEISEGVERTFTEENLEENEVVINVYPSATASYQLVSFSDATGCTTSVGAGLVEVTVKSAEECGEPGDGEEPGTGEPGDGEEPGTGEPGDGEEPGTGEPGDGEEPGTGEPGDGEEPGTGEPGDGEEPGTGEPGDGEEPGTGEPGDGEEPGTGEPGDGEEPGTGEPGIPTNCGVFSASLLNVVSPSCDRPNGSLSYEITGGTAPYFIRYTFNDEKVEQSLDGDPVLLIIRELPANTPVRIYISDAKGKECSLENILEMAPRISATFVKAENGDVSCYGEKQGKAKLAVTGGNEPFAYKLTEEEGWVSLNGRTKEFTNLPAGINSILVRDREGDECFGAAEVEILSLHPKLEISSFETEPANCNDNTGRIWIREIAGGNGGPYKLKLQGEPAFRDYDPAVPFDELARGLHTVVVSDGVCEIEQEIRVGSPGLIAADYTIMPFSCEEPTLKAGLFASINTSLTEVEEPYEAAISRKNAAGEYEIVPGLESVRFNAQNEIYQYGLENGNYAIEIRTINREGCPENIKNIVINEAEMPTPITFSHTPQHIYCADAIGGVQLSNLSGEPNIPYQISIYSEDELVAERTITRNEYAVNGGSNGVFEISGLSAGVYRMLIGQEQGGCEGLESGEPAVFKIEEKAQKLFAEVEAKTESFPERGSGSLTLSVRTNSGQEPYLSSIYLLEPLFPGQHYQSEGDEVVYDPIEATFKLTYKDMPAGKYEIYITDANGCSIVLEETIDYDQRLFIPNVITPNSDGYNDYFYIRNIPDSGTRLTITNRWGKVVFTTDNYANDWDGGDEPDGVYFYHLLVIGGESGINMKGYVEIRRGGRP